MNYLKTLNNELHETLYLASYGILCHYGNYSNDEGYEAVYKYCHSNLL